MKINCISCGHSFALDDAYNDFVGLVKCYVCGGLLDIKTAEGKLHWVKIAGRQPRAKSEPMTLDEML